MSMPPDPPPAQSFVLNPFFHFHPPQPPSKYSYPLTRSGQTAESNPPPLLDMKSSELPRPLRLRPRDSADSSPDSKVADKIARTIHKCSSAPITPAPPHRSITLPLNPSIPLPNTANPPTIHPHHQRQQSAPAPFLQPALIVPESPAKPSSSTPSSVDPNIFSREASIKTLNGTVRITPKNATAAAPNEVVPIRAHRTLNSLVIQQENRQENRYKFCAISCGVFVGIVVIASIIWTSINTSQSD
jgi:hypothetical protein